MYDSQEESEVPIIQQGANVAKKDWKTGLMFSKLPDMPKSDWKKSKK